MINDTNDFPGTHEEAWPFEEITRFGHAAARERQRRFQAYIADSNPNLSVALTAEAARFDEVKRTVIEPAMREVAEDAVQRGWHVSVVLDDDLDRLDVFATPGIRFYCTRRPSRGSIPGLIWPPCFIAFYGCAQMGAVRTFIDRSEIDAAAAPGRGEPLAYPDVTSGAVRTMLIAFIEDLKRPSSRVEGP